MSTPTDPEREDRIIMQIVVDTYGPEERAMGWYCYLENEMTFPFQARCTQKHSISPLRLKDTVKVISMADSDECLHEMFVQLESDDDELAVPLSQLQVVKGNGATRRAVEDWRYWVEQGYHF